MDSHNHTFHGKYGSSGLEDSSTQKSTKLMKTICLIANSLLTLIIYFPVCFLFIKLFIKRNDVIGNLQIYNTYFPQEISKPSKSQKPIIKMSSINSAQTASFMREKQEQLFSRDDISITSDSEDEPKINFCEGGLFAYQSKNSFLDLQLYPQVFQEYPHDLVKSLNQFTRPFSHHKVTKLLNYEANMSFLISQIRFKLDKLKKYYQNDKKLESQMKLLEFYLTVHSMSNTSLLYIMIWILLGEREISYSWPSQRKKAFISLKENQPQLIDRSKGIDLTKKINNYLLGCVKKCIKLKYDQGYVPEQVDQMYLKLFDNDNKKPLLNRIKLISKEVGLDQIRKFFQDKELREHQISITRDYFKSLYKQVYKFYEIKPNENDRTLIELLYMSMVAQFHSEDFPFWIMKYIQAQKDNLLNNSSQVLNRKNYPNFIFESNICLRTNLPQFYFLMKRNGFMKILSLLHESSHTDITKEIVWNLSLFPKKGK